MDDIFVGTLGSISSAWKRVSTLTCSIAWVCWRFRLTVLSLHTRCGSHFTLLHVFTFCTQCLCIFPWSHMVVFYVPPFHLFWCISVLCYTAVYWFSVSKIQFPVFYVTTSQTCRPTLLCVNRAQTVLVLQSVTVWLIVEPIQFVLLCFLSFGHH